MKELNKDNLSLICGGGAGDVVDGVCSAILAYGVYARIVSLAIPVAGQVIMGGCAVWSIGSGFDWW